MKKQSAGLLVYRTKNGQLEVLIIHNGGPWFKNKDKGYWSIPKGEFSEKEDPKGTAKREFKEELSLDLPSGDWLDLGTVKQKSGKIVIAWAVEGDIDTSHIKSNTVKKEWPPRSGKIMEWPEVDKAEWFTLEKASEKINAAQIEFLKRLANRLGVSLDTSAATEDEKPKQNSLF
ncbi:MAG TPA: NUDIX domain-containing protein [Candidatus Saccharimonadales bacterium]|nr:NUDIX domain-containing protein [Candidatus Saccharimonadales bacterium]